MFGLLLAVTLSAVAPDPIQTPAALLARRLATAEALDFDAPLAKTALDAQPLVRACTSGVAPLGTNLLGVATELAQTFARPQCDAGPVTYFGRAMDDGATILFQTFPTAAFPAAARPEPSLPFVHPIATPVVPRVPPGLALEPHPRTQFLPLHGNARISQPPATHR